MNPIRLPRVAAKLKMFAEVETRTHSRTLELRQTTAVATVTVGDGHQLCRITAPPPEGAVCIVVEPFLVDARAFARAAGEVGCGRTEQLASEGSGQVSLEDRPIMVVRMDDKSVGMAGPKGQPQTLKVEAGQMPDAQRVLDGIRGSGRLMARVDPRFMQNMADVYVAAGITSVDVSFAPALNFLATSGTGLDGATIEVAVAGIGDVQLDAPAKVPWEQPDDGPMVFTMAEVKPKKSATRRPKTADLNLPIDDIPF